MFKRFFLKLFTREKWEAVYITQDVEQYARIRGKLMDNNITVRTKFFNHNAGYVEARGYYGRTQDMTTYEILVKEADINKANQIVHNC
ncbi:MAG: hypothetical protein PWP27_1750 [Clostridiales bacterium]|jgi:hypothetical protein|nr:hypothetical protein [Clostridiales bacterium]